MKKLDRNWRSRFLRTIISWRNSPEAIARGLAIGAAIAFLPAIGLQMIAAAILSTVLKANRAVAILATWISNPITMPPLFLFTYRLGSMVIGGKASNREYNRFLALLQKLTGPSGSGCDFLGNAANLGAHILLSLTVGGLIAGLISAAVCYPLALWMGRRFRTYREQRRARHSKRG